MNAKAIDFVCYTVTEIERSVEFFRDTIGLALERLDEEAGWAEFAAPPTTLALGEVNPRVPITPGEGGVSLALGVDDVTKSVEELRDEGMTILMEPVETTVCDMAIVEDPDGNPFALHHRHDGTHGRRDPF